MVESKDTNFDYFISMTLRKKIPWSMLLVFLDDLTPTLVKSKQAIEILVRHLQCLHAKLQDKAIDEETLDVEIIESLEKSRGKTEIENIDKAPHDSNESVAVINNDGEETETITPDIFHLEPESEDQTPDVSEIQDVTNTEANETSEIGPSNVIDVRDKDKSGENEINEIIYKKDVENDVDANDHVTIETAEGFQHQIDELENQNQLDTSENSEHQTLSFQINGEDSNVEFEDVIHQDESQKNLSEKVAKYKKNSDFPEPSGRYCKICQKTVTSPGYLRIHLRIHSKIKPFKCQTCSKGFVSSSELNRHCISHFEGKKFQCKYCEKRFKVANSLKYHERNHTEEKPEKPFPCKYCKNSFNTPSPLKRHEIIHTRETPFRCKTCDKRFTQLVTLQIHERQHNGEMPHDCKNCGKSFKQKSNLIYHERRHHTGEKPFECKTCGKRFFASGNLKAHSKVHLKVRENNL